jgi:hypothetical protein
LVHDRDFLGQLQHGGVQRDQAVISELVEGKNDFPIFLVRDKCRVDVPEHRSVEGQEGTGSIQQRFGEVMVDPEVWSAVVYAARRLTWS